MSTMFTTNPRRRSSIKQALVFAAIALCSFNVAVHGAPTPQQQPPAPGTLPENAQVIKLPNGEMSGMVPPVAFIPDELPDEGNAEIPNPTNTVSQPQETRQATITTIIPTSTPTVVPAPTEPVADPVPLPIAPQLAASGASTRGGRRAQVDAVSAADAATAATAAAANVGGDVQAANLDLGRLLGAITGNGGANIGRVIGAVTRGTTGIIGAANGDLSQIPGIIGAVTDGLGAVGDIVGDVNGGGEDEQPPVSDDQEEGGQEEEEEVATPGAGNRGRNVVDGIGGAARTIGQIGQVGRQLGLFNANEAGQAPGVPVLNGEDDAAGIAVMPQVIEA